MKKISQILFAIIMILMLASCKNTKQKLQEHVKAYNSASARFKAEHVTNTTARGYIDDNKIELRIETDLEQNELNKTASIIAFPKLLKEMLDNNQISKELIEEGVQFDVYFLANDNTVLAKKIINKKEMPEFLKEIQ
jgi:hypothetical protein